MIKLKIYELDMNNIPAHIAFIMDGNGRWAKQQNKLRTFWTYKRCGSRASCGELCTTNWH